MEEKKQELDIKEAFIDYFQTIDDVHENLGDYNPTKKRKGLLLLDDNVIKANKILSSLFTELFIRGRDSVFYLLLFDNLISKSVNAHDTLFYHENT